jgi:hypothetical protein
MTIVFLLNKEKQSVAASAESVKSKDTHPIWYEVQNSTRMNIIVLGETSTSPNKVARGIGEALKNILVLFENPKKVQIRLISELTASEIRNFNIIYIGDFQSMGILKNYFKGSSLSLVQRALTLDKQGSEVKFEVPNENFKQYLDYGLFAKYNGPKRQKVYLLAGYTNSSIIELSRLFSSIGRLKSRQFLNELKQYELASHENMELLFKVSSIEDTPLSYEIISGKPVNSDIIWK